MSEIEYTDKGKGIVPSEHQFGLDTLRSGQTSSISGLVQVALSSEKAALLRQATDNVEQDQNITEAIAMLSGVDRDNKDGIRCEVLWQAITNSLSPAADDVLYIAGAISRPESDATGFAGPILALDNVKKAYNILSNGEPVELECWHQRSFFSGVKHENGHSMDVRDFVGQIALRCDNKHFFVGHRTIFDKRRGRWCKEERELNVEEMMADARSKRGYNEIRMRRGRSYYNGTHYHGYEESEWGKETGIRTVITAGETLANLPWYQLEQQAECIHALPASYAIGLIRAVMRSEYLKQQDAQ